MTFPELGDSQENYLILATDYKNAAVIWNCIDISSSVSAESAWILSRERVLSDEGAAAINDVIDKYLDRDFLIPYEQGDQCE